MSYTPIAQGTLNWDVPVNAAFVDQDTRITNNAANTASNSSAISGNTTNINTLLARLPVLGRKTADQLVNNTTTYADATGLTVAVTAGNTYKVEGIIVYNTTLAAGINLKLTGPTGTGSWTFASLSGNGTSTDTGNTRWAMSSNGVGTGRPGGAGGSDIAAYVRGIFLPTANGNFQFAFAQNVATAVDTTVRANSWIELTRMN